MTGEEMVVILQQSLDTISKNIDAVGMEMMTSKYKKSYHSLQLRACKDSLNLWFYLLRDMLPVESSKKEEFKKIIVSQINWYKSTDKYKIVMNQTLQDRNVLPVIKAADEMYVNILEDRYFDYWLSLMTKPELSDALNKLGELWYNKMTGLYWSQKYQWLDLRRYKESGNIKDVVFHFKDIPATREVGEQYIAEYKNRKGITVDQYLKWRDTIDFSTVDRSELGY